MVLEEIQNIQSGKRELREFGLLVGAVLAVIGGLLWWRGKPLCPYFLITGLILIVLGAFSPFILKPLQRLWMTLAVLIGWLMSRVLLSILFYLVVTPIGLITKAMGKDLLDLKFREDKSSYWIPRPKDSHEPKSYEKQF